MISDLFNLWGLWDRLTIDTDALLQAEQGFVGYPSTTGDDLAVAIFEDQTHTTPGSYNLQQKNTMGLKSKVSTSQQKSNAMYYQGAATAFMALLAYGAFVHYKKDETSKINSSALLDVDQEFTLV